MQITITNRIGKPAKKYLEDFKSRFPSFIITKYKAYNGIVIDIDDDDSEDFFEALETAGFDFESEQETSGQKPKLDKNAPKFPKQTPKFPKVKPIFGKTIPKLPRSER